MLRVESADLSSRPGPTLQELAQGRRPYWVLTRGRGKRRLQEGSRMEIPSPPFYHSLPPSHSFGHAAAEASPHETPSKATRAALTVPDAFMVSPLSRPPRKGSFAGAARTRDHCQGEVPPCLRPATDYWTFLLDIGNVCLKKPGFTIF